MNQHTNQPTYLVGDLHGAYERIVALLQAAGLINGQLAWCGGQAALWCLGDFFDRGPDGIAVVDLWMRLGQEASAAGGTVAALLGNHDVLIMAVQRFGGRTISTSGASFERIWLRNGGKLSDLARLTAQHSAWLSQLPALALVEQRLLLHADSLLYLEYGHSIAEVNAAFRRLLRSNNPSDWHQLLDRFSDRFAFDSRQPGAAARVARMLGTFGGRQLIHGHTPISNLLGRPAAQVLAPYVYQGGRCIDLDGGLYQGGPGFIERLGPLDRRL